MKEKQGPLDRDIYYERFTKAENSIYFLQQQHEFCVTFQ